MSIPLSFMSAVTLRVILSAVMAMTMIDNLTAQHIWREIETGHDGNLLSIAPAGDGFVLGGAKGAAGLVSGDMTTRLFKNEADIEVPIWGAVDAGPLADADHRYAVVGSRRGGFPNSGHIFMSSDGINWLLKQDGLRQLREVVHDGSRWLAVGGSSAYTSERGDVWTQHSVFNRAINDVVWSGERFVAVGAGANRAYSMDGEIWHDVSNSDSAGVALNSVTWGEDRFVAVGRRGSSFDQVFVSSDGATWSNHSISGIEELFGVAYGAGWFVAVGESGNIHVSDDGMNWMEVSSPTALTLNDVAFNGYAFAAVGEDGQLLVSQIGESTAPPIITFHPKDENVSLGTPALFGVGLDADEPLQFQWFKNGVKLDSGFEGSEGQVLDLTPATYSDGGSYTLAVWNDEGGYHSAEASLTFSDLPRIGLADNAADAPLLTSGGYYGGDNLGATREAGEPRHADAPGGSSVWYRFEGSGFPTRITTAGSTFDTVIAVYRRDAASNSLEVVVSDDDGGGYLTSEVVFGTVFGEEYLVAIDGYGGEQGELVILHTVAAGNFVEIRRHPVDLTAPLGGEATLMVEATGIGLTYQWRRNGAAIPGATGPVLLLNDLQPSDAGTYEAVVNGPGGATDTSRAARLDIGDLPEVHFHDKFADALDEIDQTLGGEIQAAAFHAAGLGFGYLPPTMGQPANHYTSASQLFPKLEPDRVITSASFDRELYDAFVAAGDGYLFFEATLDGEPVSAWLYEVSQDEVILSSQDLDQTKLATLRADGRYVLVMNVHAGEEELVAVRFGTGSPPEFETLSPDQQLPLGAVATLFAEVAAPGWETAMSWSRDGVPLPDASSSQWQLGPILEEHYGWYRMHASNVFGSSISGAVLVSRLPDPASPPRLDGLQVGKDGSIVLNLRGATGIAYDLQVSDDLRVWRSVGTGMMNDDTGELDGPEIPQDAAFFRLKIW